jgi:hypothetical protein
MSAAPRPLRTRKEWEEYALARLEETRNQLALAPPGHREEASRNFAAALREFNELILDGKLPPD